MTSNDKSHIFGHEQFLEPDGFFWYCETFFRNVLSPFSPMERRLEPLEKITAAPHHQALVLKHSTDDNCNTQVIKSLVHKNGLKKKKEQLYLFSSEPIRKNGE